MSEESIGQCQPRARKNHRCNWCHGRIVVGEVYERWAWIDEGKATTVKAHQDCFKYAMKIQDSYCEPVWFDGAGHRPSAADLITIKDMEELG